MQQQQICALHNLLCCCRSVSGCCQRRRRQRKETQQWRFMSQCNHHHEEQQRLPMTAKGSSENKSRSGNEKDCKPKEPKKPISEKHIAVRSSSCLALPSWLQQSQRSSCSGEYSAEGQQKTGVHVCCSTMRERHMWSSLRLCPRIRWLQLQHGMLRLFRAGNTHFHCTES